MMKTEVVIDSESTFYYAGENVVDTHRLYGKNQQLTVHRLMNNMLDILICRRVKRINLKENVEGANL